VSRKCGVDRNTLRLPACSSPHGAQRRRDNARHRTAGRSLNSGIFAGISLEVCAAFPAITAVGKGLDAYVAVDASGTFSETKR